MCYMGKETLYKYIIHCYVLLYIDIVIYIYRERDIDIDILVFIEYIGN